MNKSVGRNLLIIFLLTFFSVLISLPRELPIKFEIGPIKVDQTFTRQPILGRDMDLKLGLDLIGGTRLTFEAKTDDINESNREKALESLKEVIARRVNLFGVSEPNIFLSTFEGKNRVVVELPGIDNTQDAIDLVGKTAQLIFAEVVEPTEGDENSQGGLVPTDLTGADLESADVVFDNVSGKPAVQIVFTPEGGDKFAEITGRNIKKVLPIVLDNDVVSAPLVQDRIEGGKAQITGEFSVEEAKNLAIQLNAGALPLNIELVEERTVGATLGSDSIDKSVRAGLIGIAVVMVFMIVMYRKLGVVADVGLIIYGVMTLALYKIIPVVLTLPGIAGFLLSVGMAVDSNILIFERFREEKIKGVNLEYAMEISFGRAWDSIRDANIATLVTAFILANPFDWQFLHTSGPVRGFAITLAIGVGLSMFTGIFVSRNLLRLFIRSKFK